MRSYPSCVWPGTSAVTSTAMPSSNRRRPRSWRFMVRYLVPSPCVLKCSTQHTRHGLRPHPDPSPLSVSTPASGELLRGDLFGWQLEHSCAQTCDRSPWPSSTSWLSTRTPGCPSRARRVPSVTSRRTHAAPPWPFEFVGERRDGDQQLVGGGVNARSGAASAQPSAARSRGSRRPRRH
jgi:hypothetical protein